MAGLAITDLRLSHFRSHRAARLGFDGRPVALIGPNGAGKTNLLEAISLLSPGRGLRRAQVEEFARRPDMLGWKIRASVQGFGAAHEVETWAEPGQTRQVRIDGKAHPQNALGRITRMLWLVPSMDRLWIDSAEGRRGFLDRMVLSFEPDHADAVLSYEKAMRERNRLLKDQVTDAHWYRALEERMITAAALIEANRAALILRLEAAQAGADTAFPRAGLTLTNPEPVEDFGTSLSRGRSRDMAAGRTLTGPHRADLAAIFEAKGVTAAQCSTGEQKALLISLILANARALAADLGLAPVLLLDEVAAHLDAGRRAALYDEIDALGAQAVMTGTEAALFDSLGPRAQCFEITEATDQSQIAERAL
jgi:DNA replication and repair protein RecF